MIRPAYTKWKYFGLINSCFWYNFIFLILAFVSCQKDCTQQMKTVETAAFRHITQGPGVEIHIRHSDSYSVRVETYASRLDELEVNVQDSILYVEAKLPGIFAADYSPVKVYVDTPQLKIIRNNGEQCIYSDGVLDFPKLILKSEDVYGDLNIGNMHLEVDSDWVQVISNGISNIELRGDTDILDLKYYNSVGKFIGEDLEANRVRIMHKAENELVVRASYYIRGDIYSVGNVRCLTRPQIIDVREHYTGQLILP